MQTYHTYIFTPPIPEPHSLLSYLSLTTYRKYMLWLSQRTELNTGSLNLTFHFHSYQVDFISFLALRSIALYTFVKRFFQLDFFQFASLFLLQPKFFSPHPFTSCPNNMKRSIRFYIGVYFWSNIFSSYYPNELFS